MSEIVMRIPRSTDAAAVFELIRQSPPLDTNSRYCNLLQCSHFADTCVVAELEGSMLGFTSGYMRPDATDTLFVWQVVVGEAARGRGLAARMLAELLRRPAAIGVRFIETTITQPNHASWRLFEKFADALSAPCSKVEYFERDAHFDGVHDTEWLVRIGPIART